jgi:hypothetical protein
MLFTIPNAIIQNPKKRKMIGPGNVIKVKPLVDTIPAITIRVPVTINKIDQPLKEILRPESHLIHHFFLYPRSLGGFLSNNSTQRVGKETTEYSRISFKSVIF